MAQFSGNTLLAQAVADHEAAVEEVTQAREAAAKQEQVEKGRQLLTELMKPDTTKDRNPIVGSHIEVMVPDDGKPYVLEGTFPLDMTEIMDEPTLVALFIVGNFATTATHDDSAAIQEDPRQSLEPKVANVTVVFKGLESNVITEGSLVTFSAQDFGGESTGFSTWTDDPEDSEPLAYDSQAYDELIKVFEEALKQRQTETIVV